MIKTLLIITILVVPILSNPCDSHYTELKGIAQGMGFIITSEMGGGHNAHSKHYRGKALDVRSRGKTNFQVDMLKLIVERHGYIFRDERRRPKGQRVWKGSHIHLSIPDCQ
jgi:hypothetical protein